jgi:uncharacterized RDD family membrane protein YckC/Tfp pilus assembly major pilin PilA
MYCQKCGQQNQDTSTACAKCGAPMVAVAAAVGASSLYAGFWRRFAAYLIDYIIVVVMAVIAAAIFGVLYAVMTGGDSGELGIFVTLLAVWWLYYALMESSQKQATLGKMALGIKVTDESGVRISFASASLRLFAKILSGLLLAIGFLMAAFTKKKQALHDMAAGCLVVNEKATAAQVQAGTPMPVSGMPWWAIMLIVMGVSVFPLGIMAAITIPAYQDFTMRAKIADAMGGVYDARAAVAAYQKNHDKWPANLEEARRDAKSAESRTSPHVERLEVEPHTGLITLTLAKPLGGKVIEFVPQVDGDNVNWRCRSDNVPARYLPAFCRNNMEAR